MRTLPDQSVHTCVTSPPYFGLRDYGVDGQIGLEPSPDEYVAALVDVFREVRRVLRDDGTLWLNLGDSYAANQSNNGGYSEKSTLHGFTNPNTKGRRALSAAKPRKINHGLKPKDLIGIPWSVAKALQAPFYTGRIKSELDRVWLAATIDAEGSICGFTHERKDDGTTRTDIHLTITNTNRPLLDNAFRIWPTSREDHNVDDTAELLREIYPYLIAKKKQALLAWNFLEMSRETKRLARTGEAKAVKEKQAWIVAALSKLNHFEDVDVPAWCREPPSMFEPGWHLRQDIIWHKLNPMPESVRDRCTKAHEYIFLLSKGPRYYFDAEAIKEMSSSPEKSAARYKSVFGGAKSKTLLATGQVHTRPIGMREFDGKRNRRSVWTVTTKPYKGAHFATFPPDLIEPCILAGCPPGGTVLDPFGGSGTTAGVALKHGRKAILCELNPEYVNLIPARVQSILDKSPPTSLNMHKSAGVLDSLPL